MFNLLYSAYSILDFPDLSVDGTMPLGAIVSCVLIMIKLLSTDDMIKLNLKTQ